MANTLGYKAYFVLPATMTIEKIQHLQLLGATVETVPSVSIDDPKHFSKVAEQRAKEIEGGFFSNQFYNPHNLRAHYETTGPEFWNQTNGKLDAVIMATGTGGTIGGVSHFLKEKNKDILCYMIESLGTGVKFTVKDNIIVMDVKGQEEKDKEGGSSLEGIGSSKVYYPLSQAILDGVLRADDRIAIEMAHYLLKEEGLFLGGSAALNVVGAVWLACILGPGHTIATVLCDGGANYKSKMWNEQWLKDNNMTVQRTKASDFIASFDTSKIVVQLKPK